MFVRVSLLVVAVLILAGCQDGGLIVGDDAGRFDAGNSFDGSAPIDSGEPDSGSIVLLRVLPAALPGGVDTTVTLQANDATSDLTAELDGVSLVSTFLPDAAISAQVPAHARGTGSLRLRSATASSNTLPVTFSNSAPTISVPDASVLAEEQPGIVLLRATDFDGDPVRLFVEGLPPGARFDETSGELRFTPDFTQGGQRWAVTATARDDDAGTRRTFVVSVSDDITVPTPTIANQAAVGSCMRYRIEQAASPYLERAGHPATFSAMVMVPNAASAANEVPVEVVLHGYGGAPNFASTGCGSRIRIEPGDDEDAYWWGSAQKTDGGAPTGGTVPPYLHRHILSVLEWVIDRYHGDPDRVALTGGSMGGAGAATLGLMSARHFARVSAQSGQNIPRLHRPGRLTTQIRQWGTPALNLPTVPGGLGVWDAADLTRVIAEVPEARDQHLRLAYGKDDGTIHFGAVTFASPLTHKSFFEALRFEKVGLMAWWDESGHVGSPADPVMGTRWVDTGWEPLTDAITFTRRNLAFPAFTNSSLDDNPGDGGSNGRQTWDVNAGYGGDVAVAGDTGWNGEIAGAINRFLRWDSRAIVDTIDRFEMPLELIDGTGSAAPAAGYPTLRDYLGAAKTTTVDVTPRRVQAFRLRPGENVAWEFGSQHGTATADARGDLIVPRLVVTTSWRNAGADPRALTLKAGSRTSTHPHWSKRLHGASGAEFAVPHRHAWVTERACMWRLRQHRVMRFLLALVALTSATSFAGIVWRGDYETQNLSQYDSYVVHQERWTFVNASPRSARRQLGRAHRAARRRRGGRAT